VRDISEVIEKIIREIPQDQQKGDLSRVLRRVSSSAKYTAPELMYERWNQVAEVLERYLGDPTEEWKRRIASIFTGRNSI
jgi:hypothetical protein